MPKKKAEKGKKILSLTLIPILLLVVSTKINALELLPTLNNSTWRVVCTPLPRALLIGLVFKSSFTSSLLSNEDFPAPVWPVRTIVLFFIERLRENNLLFETTI